MGNQLVASGAASNFSIQDINNALQLIAPLGGRKRGRLFTSLHCQSRADRKDIVVKVFVRNAEDKRQSDLIANYADTLATWERAARLWHRANQAAPCNVLFYGVVTRTPQFCLLQRPFVHYSLLERLQTRPFWTPELRLFACYQLLEGLRQMHDEFKITHGDLKTENIVVTSAGWLYITDMCPFKPAVIPSFNPANFEFFFDNAENSLCCLDPEKFYDEPDAGSAAAQAHTPAMDVYSAMCVLIHIMTDEPLFRLRDALEFRALAAPEKRTRLGGILRERKLAEAIVEVVLDVMCAPGSARMTAAQLIDRCTGPIFPPYFAMFHNNIVPSLLAMPPDICVQSVWNRFDDLLGAACRCLDDAEFALAMKLGTPLERAEETQASFASVSSEASPEGRADVATTDSKSWLPEEVFEPKQTVVSHEVEEGAGATAMVFLLPNTRKASRQTVAAIIAPIIACSCRHLHTADSRAKAMLLMKRLDAVCGASIRREILLPITLHSLKGARRSRSSVAQAAALKALACIASSLDASEMRSSECLMYDDLIIPALAEVAQDRCPLVQTEFARTAPLLLRYAVRYLHQRQVLIDAGMFLSTFDFQLHNIVDRGWELVKPLFGSENSAVVCAALGSVDTLVEVLGAERSMDELVPMLMTLLGSQAIDVRRQLLKQILHVLPFMKVDMAVVYASEGLTCSDPECTLTSLEMIATMVRRALLPEKDLVFLTQRAIPLLAHPDSWVADAAIALLKASAVHLSPVDILVNLEAPLRAMLVTEIPLTKLTEYRDTAIRPEASIVSVPVASTSSTAVCADYLQRVTTPQTIIINTNRIRHSGDIATDTMYVDVAAHSARKTTSVSWHMSLFYPQPRQEKRLVKRHATSAIATTLGADAARLRKEGHVAKSKWRAAGAAVIASKVQGGAASSPSLVSPRSHSPASSAAASPVASSPTPHSVPPRTLTVIDDSSTKHRVMRPIAAPLAINTMHEGPVYAMGFNGSWMVTAGHGGIVRLWDLEEAVTSVTTGILRPTTSVRVGASGADAASPQPPQTIFCAEFIHQDRNTSLLAVGGTDGAVSIVDVEAGIATSTHPVAGGAAGGLASCIPMPRQSLVLVGTHRGGLHAVDVRAPRDVWSSQLRRSEGPISKLVSLRASAAHETFAVGCSTLRGTVALFDLRFRLHLHSSKIEGNGMSPLHSICRAGDTYPSNVVVATHDAGVVQHDFASNRTVLSMLGRPACPTTALLHVPQSSLIVAGGRDRLLRVWDLDVPDRSHTVFVAPQRSPTYNFSASERVVSDPCAAAAGPFTSDAQEKISSVELRSDFVPPHHQDVIMALGCGVVKQQQYLVSASREGVVKIWHNQS